MEHLKVDAGEARRILRRSVEVALEARKEAGCEGALIAGSIGPYGAVLHDRSEYSGLYVNNMTIQELVNWHRPRFEVLVEAGVDLLAFETIPSIKEAGALCKLLEEFPSMKAWLSFSCKNGTQLCIGDSFADAYEKFRQNKQLIAIGMNCTHVSYISPLLESIQTLSTPLIVYPNDGEFVDYLDQNLKKIRKPIELFMDVLPKWLDLGVKYIGGCCGFVAEDIQTLKNQLKK